MSASLGQVRVTLRPPRADRQGYALDVFVGSTLVRRYTGTTIEAVNAAIDADPNTMIDMAILSPPNRGLAITHRKAPE